MFLVQNYATFPLPTFEKSAPFKNICLTSRRLLFAKYAALFCLQPQAEIDSDLLPPEIIIATILISLRL